MVVRKTEYLTAQEPHERHHKKLTSKPDKNARLIPELSFEVAGVNRSRDSEHQRKEKGVAEDHLYHCVFESVGAAAGVRSMTEADVRASDFGHLARFFLSSRLSPPPIDQHRDIATSSP